MPCCSVPISSHAPFSRSAELRLAARWAPEAEQLKDKLDTVENSGDAGDGDGGEEGGAEGGAEGGEEGDAGGDGATVAIPRRAGFVGACMWWAIDRENSR